ncbi:hypothetical protein KX816_07035 [Sphingosinicellaceae bacterium]|nr:hypothetical protein KX816_07035 [Sphingosinicellaceae bacterium]
MKLKTLAIAIAVLAPVVAQAATTDEIQSIQQEAAKESGRHAYSIGHGTKFKATDHVFVKSALAIDFTFRKANVTLPLYRGIGPSGEPTYFIITESSDFDVARAMGINFAPKLAKGAQSDGAMPVTIVKGVVHLPGDVDFTPVYAVAPGAGDKPFPPSVATPGALGDANYSSLAVLPSGVVLNIQVVANSTGRHDRAVAVDLKKRTITMSLLDGMHDGKQWFYHLVTDVSAAVPSVLEKGVYAPRLGKLPTIGQSTPDDNSALLGFSPVLNGPRDASSDQSQGFEMSLANGGVDPINVFPVGPQNDNRSATNNYSPMWDAHVSQWTAAAIRDGKVRRIVSFTDLKDLIGAGLVESAFINPPAPGNPFVGGLRPTGAIINCPVIAQPELPSR